MDPNYQIAFKCLDCNTIVFSWSGLVCCECYTSSTGCATDGDGGFGRTRILGDPERIQEIKIKIK